MRSIRFIVVVMAASILGCAMVGKGKGAQEAWADCPHELVEGDCQYGDPASCYDAEWSVAHTQNCPHDPAAEQGAPGGR